MPLRSQARRHRCENPRAAQHGFRRGEKAASRVTSREPPMEIRRLTSADAPAYRMVRLAGLQEMPTAFASSYEDERGWPLSAYEKRLDTKPDRGTFGAFDGPKLIGIVTLAMESMPKLMHKAHIVGMYVLPEARGLRAGTNLLHYSVDLA